MSSFLQHVHIVQVVGVEDGGVVLILWFWIMSSVFETFTRWSVWRMGEWLGLRREASVLPLRKALFRSTI